MHCDCQRKPELKGWVALWIAAGVVLGRCVAAHAQAAPDGAASAARAAELRSRIESAPRMRFVQADLPIKLPAGESLGMVSWMSFDARTGLIWILQRGNDAPPVLAVDRAGNIVHSFGRGLFSIPHAIRVAPDGTVWAVDAGSSKVTEFSPEGKVLLQLNVSRKAVAETGAAGKGGFGGATDVAFARSHVFVSDGYVNARVVEYTAEGRKVREWGSPGGGPGEFSLPHSIVAEGDTLYVADRENGRIGEFSLGGRFLREIDGLGRVYALKVDPRGDVWATMSPLNEPPGSAGWIVRFDGRSGKITGYLPVTDTPALHALDVDADGEPMTDVGNRVVWFRSPQ